jgi:hypothetical protein
MEDSLYVKFLSSSFISKDKNTFKEERRKYMYTKEGFWDNALSYILRDFMCSIESTFLYAGKNKSNPFDEDVDHENVYSNIWQGYLIILSILLK